MRLKPNFQVPDFELKSLDNQVFTNESMLGKRYMLSFYRYASCPFCNLRISFLIGLNQELNLENQILSVFQSDVDDMKQFVVNQQPDFPLIADPEKVYYKKFGVESGWYAYLKGALKVKTMLQAFKKGFFIHHSYGEKNTIPADFLVDENGKIIFSYYGKDISDHLDIDVVEAFFKEERS